MNIIRRYAATALVIAATVVPVSAFGAVTCDTKEGKVEEFHYSWRLRGGVRFLAGFMFPTSGVGNLRTTFGDKIHSELLITAPSGKQGGYYAYESDIDGGGKTLMTYHGYSWGNKSRTERTVFDYVKGLARLHKQTPEESENQVKKLPGGGEDLRDILTAIHFLRQNATPSTHRCRPRSTRTARSTRSSSSRASARRSPSKASRPRPAASRSLTPRAAKSGRAA